jgi:hypothetical protein
MIGTGAGELEDALDAVIRLFGQDQAIQVHGGGAGIDQLDELVGARVGVGAVVDLVDLELGASGR